MADLEDILTAFDNSRKDHRDQAQDPLVRVFSPPKLKIESERREDQEISEELDKDTVRETSRFDVRPVGLKCSLKRDQIKCSRRICICASLEDKQVQKKKDIEDTEHDTADHKASAEALPDMRRVPFLVREKADQDRHGNSSDPHQDNAEPPLIVHVLKKIAPAELQTVDRENSRVTEKSPCLKKRAKEVAFRKKKHQKRQSKSHGKQEHLLHRGHKLLTESDTKGMQKHTQYETDCQYRGVCRMQPGCSSAVIACRRSLAHSVYSPQVSDSGA